MILTAHQPAYLPWTGYFNKLVKSDIFIFLDTVQFEKNSFINRNQIKTPQGPVWLTIPVKTKGHLNSNLLETKIDNSRNWKAKHLKTIFMNYKKAPYFNEGYQRLEKIYDKEYDLLSDLCYDHLTFWLEQMNMQKKVVRSSSLSTNKKKSALILELCEQFNANHYISGSLGKGYLIESDFKKAGITIEYQEYCQPIYPQLYGKFIPYMGIVDFWMNTNQFYLLGE